MKNVGVGISALLTLLMTVSANATIIGGNVTGGTAGGTFFKLSPPLSNSVGKDTFQSPNLYGFDEQQNVVLSSPLTINVPGGSLPAGTTVASHYIFFDPLLDSTIIGLVDFDATILAVITGSIKLAASDFLANPNVNYLNTTGRGLEIGDSVTISGPQQIQLNVRASSPGDYVRVLTAYSRGVNSRGVNQVPEPATLALMAIGLAGVGFRRRGKTQLA